MKRETIRHPKTYDLAARLGCSRAEALGFLTLLWDYTGEHSPQGDVGKWGNGAIARACDFTGDPDAFVEALAESKWVDRHDKHRLIIHDWPDHCEDWVRKKLERSKLRFLDCYGVDASSSVHKKRGNRELENKDPDTAAPAALRSEQASQEVRKDGATAEPVHAPAENEKHNNHPHGVPPECGTTPRGVPPSRTAESLSNPIPSQPIPTDPIRTDPQRRDTGRAGPDGISGRGGSGGNAFSGSGGPGSSGDFSVDESDGEELIEACKRLAEVIAVGKGGKPREDRELIFKTAVLRHLDALPEVFVADTLAAIKEKKPKLPAAFFLSGVQLRCEKQGMSFFWLLDKVIVPPWAVPIIDKKPLKAAEACA